MGETEWFFNPGQTLFEKPANTIISGIALEKPAPQQHVSYDVQVKEKPSYSPGIHTGEQTTARKNLQELYDAVRDCLHCSLGKGRKNLVFGEGNPDADIMFIGEAPGAEEDAQGKPFIGRAGKLLTRMIEGMKLHREDVYIGNILKCRPPNNRDPQANEIEMCEPILIRQIKIIKPKIICALGRISGQTLLRTKSTLGSLRGTVHDYHGVKFVVTYHPAALLRNPNWKKPAWEDLKLVRREYDGMEL